MSRNESTQKKEDELVKEVAQILDNLVYEFVPSCDAEDAARRIINHIQSRGGELN